MPAAETNSGQLADPGRTSQAASGKPPSGQTGVQVGKVNGVQVTSGVPQVGNEEQTQKMDVQKKGG